MKKGDLVKLKENGSWSEKEAEAIGFKSISEIPDLFEVEDVETVTFCCFPRSAFSVSGIKNFIFWQDKFEVVLPAGEPDVQKLLEESKEMQKMLVGF